MCGLWMHTIPVRLQKIYAHCAIADNLYMTLTADKFLYIHRFGDTKDNYCVITTQSG